MVKKGFVSNKSFLKGERILELYLGSASSMVLVCVVCGMVATPMIEQKRSKDTNGSIASEPGLGLELKGGGRRRRREQKIVSEIIDSLAANSNKYGTNNTEGY